MTARNAGALAAESVWTTLRRLRDQWMLFVFAASAVFWLRDVYDRFVDLPARVEALGEATEALRSALARLETGRGLTTEASPALIFAGTQQAIEDGRPGQVVTVSFSAVERVRDDCRIGDLAAFMIDAGGKWFSVETDLSRVPQIEGSQPLAFGVTVHPGMAIGRAQFLVQVTQECGSLRRIDVSPRLPFRVLAEPIRLR